MIWGLTGLLVVDWVVNIDGMYLMRFGAGGTIGFGVCAISGGVSISADHDDILMLILTSPSFYKSVIDALNISSSMMTKFIRKQPCSQMAHLFVTARANNFSMQH